MQSEATTVAEYLKELRDDRREAIEAVRTVIRKNLPRGYEEGMQYGMIGYYVPHSVYPEGYHCDPKQPVPFASIASQKNHMAIYLMCIYSDPEQLSWFQDAWAKSGRKKPDMGKSCIRFRKIEDIPLEVIGEAVKRVPVKQFLSFYESAMKLGGRKRKTSSSASPKKKVSKKKKKTKKGSKKKTSEKVARK